MVYNPCHHLPQYLDKSDAPEVAITLGDEHDVLSCALLHEVALPYIFHVLTRQPSVSARHWGIPLCKPRSNTFVGIPPVFLIVLPTGSGIVVAPLNLLCPPPGRNISSLDLINGS